MKKYRTKSGTVEEKLPGVNATVNPSEKTQIAMAGGANTLKDVQTILGQEGKRNNLKGQGAKHLVSFYNGPDDPGPAGGLGGQDDPDDPTDDNTFGGEEVGPSFGDPNVAAGSPGIYAYDPDVDEGHQSTKEELDRDILEAQKATEMTLQEQYDRGLLDAKSVAINTIGLLPGVYSQRTYDPDEEEPGLKGSPFGALGAGLGIFVGAPEIGSIIGTEIDKSIATTKAGEELSKALAATPSKNISQTNPLGMLSPTSPPSTPDEGGGDAPKKKKLIRSAANNTTLTIAEEDERPTRTQSRYRGGWRFA
jgi:hypothetical protein